MIQMVTACEYAAFSTEQKQKFETDMINELDREYAISQNYAKGLAEGKAEGLAEGEAIGEARGKAVGLAEGLTEGEAKGRHKRNLELAAAMKAENLSIIQIAKITGLSESEINGL